MSNDQSCFDKYSNGVSLLEYLKNFAENFTYEEICKLTFEQEEEYRYLLDEFKIKNSNKKSSTEEKGKSLENLVSYLLKISGKIFTVSKNLRTKTNELDQLIELNQLGKMLLKHGIINERLECFISECKNYSKKVSVTYVGKFYSVLYSNCTKLGILFSYKGVTGSGWNAGSGLIKKLYLTKERLKERITIIDFNCNDFESILNGNNLLEIIDTKLKNLQFDTDVSSYIKYNKTLIIK